VTLRERLRGWMPLLAIAGVAAVGGLVAIPLGGWDTVQLQSRVVPEHPVGEPLAGHRFTTSIDDVYLTDLSLDGFSEPDVGTTFLVVVATIENMTAEPELAISGSSFPPFVVPAVFTIDEPPGASEVSTFLLRDETFGAILNPGVADTVAYVFPVRRTIVQAGEELRIGLTDALPDEAELYQGTRWLDERIVAEVPITVRDER
jgi:hypothetical protein